MSNISFFAQPPYVIRHLQRVSSILRGEQMAAYMLNARLNPENSYENDVCIYVKPHIKPGNEFNFEGHPYLDLVDGFELHHTLYKYPEIPGIVFSDMDKETMSQIVKNKLICIPHQHVNFERRVREPKDRIKKIGLIGSGITFSSVPEEVRRGIANRGLELVEHHIMFPRMSVVDFYTKVDAMIVWRSFNFPFKRGLYNPFKIVNASAFGLPTVALDEPAFQEMEGCYLPAKNEEEFFKHLDSLISSRELYMQLYKTCLQKAERYHISNIAKLYTEQCVPYR
jgi:hypothetical protein